MEKKTKKEGLKKTALNEKTLSTHFDYQKFENDLQLDTSIRETDSLYGEEISDEDLSQVNAAGELSPSKRFQNLKGDIL